MARKKTKKRLRKLAKVLGAGLAIAGLGRAFANRNARASTDADTVKLMTSDDAYVTPDVSTKAPTKVYQDDIMRGGKGTKYQKPDLKFGQVINKKGDVQTIKPFESAGLTLGLSKRKGLSRTQKAVNKADREMSKGMLPPQLRNPGRLNITTAQGDFRRGIKDIFTNPNKDVGAAYGQQFFTDASAKKGGRIVKTKLGGKAVRGYGRAYMKGRKK